MKYALYLQHFSDGISDGQSLPQDGEMCEQDTQTPAPTDAEPSQQTQVNTAMLQDALLVPQQDEACQPDATDSACEDGAELDGIYGMWASQSLATQQLYPSFRFEQEMRESQPFRDYIALGLSVTDAYELAHRQEILEGAMRYAIRRSEQKIASSVAANTLRERENGLNAGAAAAVKIDINSLTGEQIDEYLARARRGEKIDFVTRF